MTIPNRLACSFTVLVIASSMHLACVAQQQPLLTRHLPQAIQVGSTKAIRRLPADQTMRLVLTLPLRNQAELESFIRAVSDPASPSYRHYLTVEEFTGRFSPTQEDYDSVVSFAKANGFAVVGTSPNRLNVDVEGPVSKIENAFHVQMNTYQHPAEDRTFYAPDREPKADLPFRLWHITGLDNYSIPKPALSKRPAMLSDATPAATTGSGPSSSFLGSDMRAAYYGGTALTGSGQSLGLFEFAGVDLADLGTYFNNVGQTNNVPVTLLSTDGTSTSCLHSSGCDDTEQILDMTQAIGMAPGLSGLVVYVGSTDASILNAMATAKPLNAQLSISWSWRPADPTTDDPYFEEFAAQGQTVFAAAGDSGEWTSSTTYVYPADDPYVVSVGGTDLQTSSANGAWSSETAWVDGGGGISPDGISAAFYQTAAVADCSFCSTAYRNGPDVSANANWSFYVCADQTTCTANEYGGTSFAAPMWAGYMALANQRAVAQGGKTAGFINPALYALYSGSGYSSDFHDIITGTNGDPAATGYDLATGLGSPNGAALINALSTVPSFGLFADPVSLTSGPATSTSTTVVAEVFAGFSSSIALSANGQPNGVTVTFSPTSIAAPGTGTSTIKIAVGSGVALGTYPITITGTGNGVQQSVVISLIVATPTFSLSASPASISVAPGANGTSTITTSSLYGFNSQIGLSASGQPAGVTVGFSPAAISAPGNGSSQITLTVGATVAPGTYPITVTGSGAGVIQTATVSLIVPAPSFSVSASPTSIAVGQTTNGIITITTSALYGFNSTISFAASGQPAGVSVNFSPATIAPPGSGSSQMTISVASTAATGTYPITVTCVGGNVTQTVAVTLVVTPPPNFSMSIFPSSMGQIAEGGSASFTIYTGNSNGFNSQIALSATGLPAGDTISFNPATIPAPGYGSSTATVAVGANTTPGVYPITITGAGGGIASAVTYILTVPTPSFSLYATLNSPTVYQGQGDSFSIQIVTSNGFNSAVMLSVSGQPAGVTVTYSPASFPAPGNGEGFIDLVVASTTVPGTYPITVTAVGGGVTRTVAAILTVLQLPGLTMSASPGAITIYQGGSNSTTITTTGTGSFNNTVSLDAGGTAPGISWTFNPVSIAAPGNGSSTLTVAVVSTMAPGAYNISVIASGDGISVSTIIPITVVPPPAVQSVNIGTSTPVVPFVFTFASATTLGSTSVLTQGVPGLDFADSGTGTCIANTAFEAGQTCTVNVIFTPALSGIRTGAVVLQDLNGNVIDTAYLQGQGVGPQIRFLPGTQNTIPTSASNGMGEIAVDGSGNVYVTDTNNNRILKETLTSGRYVESTVASDLLQPGGVAVDSAGNVFIADTQNARVLEETPTSGGYTESTVVYSFSELGNPLKVAVDGSGNLIVAFSTFVSRFLGVDSYDQYAFGGNGYSNPSGLAVDGSGNIFVADTGNNAVKEVLPSGSTVTLLGGLSAPAGLAIDGQGNLYVADTGNNRVLEILKTGGYTTVQIMPGNFTAPTGLTVSGVGNLYAASSANNLVTKNDFADPPSLTFANTPVGSTSSDSPQTVTLENVGNAALSFPAPASGGNPSISTNFGWNSGGASGCPLVTSGSAQGTLAAGQSCLLPISFAPTQAGTLSGTLTLTDNALNINYASQQISLSGTGYTGSTQQSITFTTLPTPLTYAPGPISLSALASSGLPVAFSVISGPATVSGAALTLSGAGVVVIAANQAGNATYAAAPQVTQTVFVSPTAPIFSPAPGSYAGPQTITLQSSPGATIYYTTNGTKPTTSSTVYTGPITVSSYARLIAIAAASGPSISPLQIGQYSIEPTLSAPASGMISTFAGNGYWPFGCYTGDYEVPTNATFGLPYAVAADANGNIYVVDSYYNTVRKVTLATGLITTVVGGYGCNNSGTYADFGSLGGLAIDAAGDIYIADSGNSVIWKLSSGTGTITTVAGNGQQGYAGDSGPATNAALNCPGGVALDGAGDIYIVDSCSSVVRKVTAATGVISTVAGNGNGPTVDGIQNGVCGRSGDGGLASQAELCDPSALAVDSSGNIYIADRGNAVVREIYASNGVISTVAGNGSTGYSGDNGPATSAAFAGLWAIAVDTDGNLIIADGANSAIRRVSATTHTITTIAGTGNFGYNGDGIPATNAELYYPTGVTLDASGNVYIADYENARVRIMGATQ